MKAQQVEEVKVYAVYTNTDCTEGRGHEYVLYFCQSLSTAIRLGRGRYVQGSDCPVHEVTGYRINDKLYVTGNRIEQPNANDIVEDRAREAKEQAQVAKDAAIAKARTLGLSEDEIAAILAV